MDILVNNVGIFEPKPFEAIPDADWFRFFEVNVMSGVRLARAYLPGMRARNWGRVVFVSSESAVQIPVEMIHYGMTKTAQLAIARGLAEATVGTGVTVNSVLPGPTASEGVSTFVGQMADARGVDADTMEREFFATARPSSLLKRFDDARGDCRDDRLRLQRAGVRHQRRRPARGRRRHSLDGVIIGTRASPAAR